MASNEMYKTRAGIQPSEQELPFSITTADVEQYLQRKLNVVVNGMRQNKLYDGDDIEVKVITVEMGSKFIPFTVVLPMDVLKNKDKSRFIRKDEPSIFNPKQSDATVIIHEPIMKMFSSYVFDKADGEAFYSADWRRARGVSTTTSAVLKRNRLPRIQKLNNGTMEKVTFLIDPIRVFHDMLMMDNNNANFRVEIENWQKIRSGEFRYDMKRVINKKKNKKGGSSFADELNRKMRGFNK
jgi:hypothetical protein